MPPKKAVEEKSAEQIVEDFIESPIEKLENRVAVLEKMMERLYGNHYGGIHK